MFHKRHKIGKTKGFTCLDLLRCTWILYLLERLARFILFLPSRFLVDDEGRAWIKDIRFCSGKSSFSRHLLQYLFLSSLVQNTFLLTEMPIPERERGWLVGSGG